MTTALPVCAISDPTRVKTAALLFEKVWVPSHFRVAESSLAHSYFTAWADANVPHSLAFDSESIWHEYENALLGGSGRNLERTSPLFDALPLNLHHLAALLRRDGVDATQLFDSADSFQRAYVSPRHVTYQAAFNNIEVVDEAQLTWSQVIDFRKDEESCGNYRRLRIWLRQLSGVQGVAEATDLIGEAVERYAAALHKHGIITKVGVLSELLDHRTSLSATTAAAAAVVIGSGDVAAALLAGLVIAGRLVIKIADCEVARRTVIESLAYRDTAVIYDAIRL